MGLSITLTHPALWLLCNLAATVFAQSIIPPGLSSGFSDNIGLEVSFQGLGSRFDGIPDGSTVPAAGVSSNPVFALSDQSAVNTRVEFLVMMLDTTDAANPVLHFAQDQFKADGVQTGIASQAQPLVPYAAPGSLGETGSRQYSFLLFQQLADISGLPRAGETLDVAQFLTANNMKAARAGVGISVNMAGGAAVPSSSASQVAPSNTPIATVTPVVPTAISSETSVTVLPTTSIATGQPLPSSTLLTSAATGTATSSTSAASGTSGTSGSQTSSGDGTVTAGGSIIESVSTGTLGLVACVIGGMLLG
ncbi:hypothetical protein N8I77_011682 [Diaporthe amygdali]|uniref:PEBP-like protein n=1 Tax=Phomopsis amygdali TaxID=1214568 RepID=A0AAD9VZ63_PHOAM|nr:hypothetical protein N8I77_011682 [Diaporthe amygdali]